ncbi:MAG: TolC family protein [Terriglobia bacterium]
MEKELNIIDLRQDLLIIDRRSSTISPAARMAVLVALTLTLALSQGRAQGQESVPPPESTIQLMQPSAAGPSGSAGAMVTITLQDALERARKNSAQFLAAATDARSAREDRVQARAALLPTVSESTQYLGTQGNGVFSSGRYVTNDGVHVYREWAVLHQDLSPGAFMRTGYRRASAAEALAQAKAEVARRGLDVTVTRDYEALVVSERKYGTAQASLDQARHFLEITQAGERVGQTAHSDEIKAELQFEQQKQSFEETKLSLESDRLTLAVLLSPTLNENFSVVDDLDSPRALPPFTDVQAMAEKQNPDLHAAVESLRAAKLDVSAARNALLPSLTLDVDYGIEANAFALRSRVSADPRLGPLPNLGYFATAVLNVPVWDWGALRSKLHQAEYRRQQAQVELSQTQREAVSNLYSFYNEVLVVRGAVESVRHAADLAAESLRLTNLRYQAGESTALEVVDAQNTLTQSRNAYDDAEARYRLALANLQTLTGSF